MDSAETLGNWIVSILFVWVFFGLVVDEIILHIPKLRKRLKEWL